jgi:hypothetical protein
MLNNKNLRLKKVIGNYAYSPNDQIGAGFSSSVFRGKNLLNDQVVAIKVYNLKINKIRSSIYTPSKLPLARRS